MRNTGILRTLLFSLFVFTGTVAHAQLWTTDFEGTNANVTLNTNDLGGVGVAGNNIWVINADYTGGTVGPITVPPTPPQPAAIVPNGQNYLHITSLAGQVIVPPIQNAHYDTTATAGESYFTEIATGISTVGQTNVSLSFWFLNASPATQAEVYIKDGAGGTWTQLPDVAFTNSLGGVSANWVQTTYNGTLLDGRNALFIGVRFIASLTGGQPSFSIDNMEITAPPTVTATLQHPTTAPTIFCQGDTVQFKAVQDPNIISYQWNFNGGNNGIQTIIGPNANFEAGTPGNYLFELIVSDGIIQDIFSWNVTIDPCADPTIIISGTPTTICTGTQVTFNNQTLPGSSPITGFQWTFVGGTPLTSTANNPVVTYNTPGIYDVYFQVVDGNGTYRDTLENYITVQVCPPPIAGYTASSRTICPGDCISFTDQSQNMGGNSQWLWQFPGSDSSTSNVQNPQNICYQVPGLYDVTLTATNVNGSDTETRGGYIIVDSCLSPTAGFIAERDSICQNTCVQFITQSLRADSLAWTFFGADAPYTFSNELNPIVCYSDTGLFDVQLVATNEFGVDVELEVDRISVRGYPAVQASDDEVIIIGTSVQLEAFGTSGNFIWSPNIEINDVFSRTPTVSPKENTVYYVTDVNANGCTSTDSVRVTVRQEYFSGVPDIFSPNGDDQNDILYVRGNGITEIEFLVFNRYGQQVFSSLTQEVGWDGTFKGRELDPGVFVYYAKVTYLNGFQEVLKGDVTLVR